jgi:hypothetical protein
MPLPSSQYIVPALDASESDRLGWLTEVEEEGLNFLKSQRAWADIDAGVDIIAGTANPKVPKNLSRLFVNMAKHDVRDAVATLANMRPLWGFKTDNDDYQKQATVLNKMLRAWYFNPFVRRGIRKVLQYACGQSLGWGYPTWKQSLHGGRGEISLEGLGPRAVKPFGLPADGDIQGAYAVTITIETPIQLAMEAYPTQLDKIVPDRAAPTWMRRGVRRVQRFLSPLLNALGPGSGRDERESPFPTVDIHYTYIRDTSINTTKTPIWMGVEGTKWWYQVHPYNEMIPTGQYDQNGRELLRKATREDAMLFPLRRLSIWTKQGVLYDNSSPWWHGKVPVVRFATDDWPWDFLAYPMTRDSAPIQDAATRLLRAIDDSANTKLDMPLAYDESAVSQGLMDRFNPRRPGQRIKINSQINDKPITLPVPADYYSIGAEIASMPDKLFEWMHMLNGTRDLQAIAKARQVPSGDSMEKLMELSGPLITDMSMNMEGSMVELGEMWKGLAFEFYDLSRRVQILGQDGVTEEDYDFNPGDMIPSHLPDELEKIKQSSELAKKNGQTYPIPASRASQVERARAHLASFVLHITPNSLHQITQLTKKLIYLQLWRGGFPIDPWSVAEAMDIDNYGNPMQLRKILGLEDVADDKFGRWLAWKELMSKLAGQPGTPGRKPSGQTPPTMQQKDGGTRSVVRESAR